jgi:predicted transglutaminase-like cysteine proteinase
MHSSIRTALLILLLLSSPTHAVESNDMTGFTKWNRVVSQTWVIAPAKPFAGNLKAKLDKVQARYLRVRYVEDKKNYKLTDYWATPAEMRAKRSGDCEDFAIAEYFDLVKAGVDERKLWIIIVAVKATKETHAVLRAGEWILDRRMPRVISIADFEEKYTPIYRINRKAWAPMNLKSRPAVVLSTAK